MMAIDVINLYNGLEDLGIKVWLDGGWGVDALLEKETRDHSDVDVVVQQKDVVGLRKYLESNGYEDVERDDTRVWNFVLGNAHGKLIDIHVIVLDERGNGVYGPAENNVMYPADSLTGMGKINGQSVRCLSANYQVESHGGYQLKEKDYKDVKSLCNKFAIPLPEEYKKFEL